MTDPEAVAVELLTSYLTEHQRRTYRKYGFFYVRSHGRVYALADGWNVYECDQRGKPVERRQFKTFKFRRDEVYGLTLMDAGIPDADQLLAQKLLIEANHGHFNETACRSSVPSGLHPALYSGRFLEPARRGTVPPEWPAVDGLFGAPSTRRPVSHAKKAFRFVFAYCIVLFGVESFFIDRGLLSLVAAGAVGMLWSVWT